ncbi:hypothetical protein Moror_9503 [Moniliophthora roreri MCA 2997]|uniref:Uncharacterized protein n=1 Tax=Moniliophthora roreri (strain MCA 2997) TaxID=1381753 RepID=V2Y2S0_MONRO|nr:hypothetical protein Moror_9503 [Moniliophthora roreri MCA 2997]
MIKSRANLRIIISRVRDTVMSPPIVIKESCLNSKAGTTSTIKPFVPFVSFSPVAKDYFIGVPQLASTDYESHVGFVASALEQESENS